MNASCLSSVCMHGCRKLQGFSWLRHLDIPRCDAFIWRSVIRKRQKLSSTYRSWARTARNSESQKVISEGAIINKGSRLTESCLTRMRPTVRVSIRKGDAFCWPEGRGISFYQEKHVIIRAGHCMTWKQPFSKYIITDVCRSLVYDCDNIIVLKVACLFNTQHFHTKKVWYSVQTLIIHNLARWGPVSDFWLTL